CMVPGRADGFGLVAARRLLRGAGEGRGCPAGTRAVAEWFPAKERSTAMGIINAGTAVGMVVAPPLIALLLAVTSWRSIFFVTGALGLAWTGWWRRDYFPPEEHPKLGDEERAQIRSVLQARPAGQRELGWLQL